MKNKILVILGESSSGKDFLLKQLVKSRGYTKAVSYTTRSIRPQEIDGVDYHFVTNEEFLQRFDNGEIFERTEYVTNVGTWLYGYGVDSIDVDKKTACIANPHGVDQLIEYYGADNITLVRIICSTDERIIRYCDRLGFIENMTIEQKAEMADRLLRDIDDFYEFDKEVERRYDNTWTYNGCDLIIIDNNTLDDISYDLADELTVEDFLSEY